MWGVPEEHHREGPGVGSAGCGEYRMWGVSDVGNTGRASQGGVCLAGTNRDTLLNLLGSCLSGDIVRWLVIPP